MHEKEFEKEKKKKRKRKGNGKKKRQSANANAQQSTFFFCLFVCFGGLETKLVLMLMPLANGITITISGKRLAIFLELLAWTNWGVPCGRFPR
jgi:hypothetical protein